MRLLPSARRWTPDPYALILTSVYRSGEDYSTPSVVESSKSFSQRIRRQASDLGFELVGIVPALPLTAERERLKEWLARGYHGAMSWMARDPEQRTDPRQIFPAARSVIVVALNYYTSAQHTSLPDTGKISRYARGDDYHVVVGNKLRALLAWIQDQEPTAAGKVCVDIQPMLDKAWAARAGLGWIGKHTNLINSELGSWIFHRRAFAESATRLRRRTNRRSLRHLHSLHRCVYDRYHRDREASFSH